MVWNLWKFAFSAEFRANSLELYRDFSFSQKFLRQELGEIRLFYVVLDVSQGSEYLMGRNKPAKKSR